MKSNNKRKPPYPSTLLASVIVLTMIGCYGWLMIQGNSFIKKMRENVSVVVELRPNATEADAQTFIAWLKQSNFTKPNSLKIITKEEGARILNQELGTDILHEGYQNPLYDIVTFHLKASFTEPSKIQKIESTINNRDETLEAYLQKDSIAYMSNNINKIAIGGAAIGLLLMIGVVLLALHTTRLALLSKSTIIKNMELVGASWSFISRPFLRRSLWLGLSSGIIASILVFIITLGLEQWVGFLVQKIALWQILSLFTSLIVLGILLNWLSTYRVVRKTLRLRVDDLEAQ